MMKWIPFNALMEQSDYLSDLLHGRTRIEKPILSPDQEEELNYNLEMACIFKNEIPKKIFKQQIDINIKEEKKFISPDIDLYRPNSLIKFLVNE